MNIDYIIWNEQIRENNFNKDISKNNFKYYNDSCKTIKKYAKEQNTIYNPITNQMLYGINSGMKVSGVSDGTCNQINPYIFQPQNICGAGAAGGNRCIYDTFKNYGLENFDCNNYQNSCNITHFITILLLIIILIGVIYCKYLDNKL